MERIFLSQPHLCGREIDLVNKAMESNYLTYFGEYVDLFENRISNYFGGLNALATNSGTSSIHLGLKALGVGLGDLVFCSSFTFIASANPAVYLGAELVFIDSEPATWNMSPRALRKAFKWAQENNRLPKVVIAVDLYGQSVDYDQILEICQSYKVPLLEDATEALGALYKGRKCGTFGVISALSFASNKLITASGGGMVLTEDAALYKRMAYLGSQAKEPLPYYLHNDIGYNYRLSNVNAAIGSVQAELIDERVKQKVEIYKRYKQGFEGQPIHMMPLLEGSCAWLSLIYFEENDPMDIVRILEENNIESRLAWKPLHTQPIFEENLFFEHDGDFCQDLFDHCLCLPSATIMTNEEQDRIIEVIIDGINRKKKTKTHR